MSKTIASVFGTLSDEEITKLKTGIREMSDLMTIMDSQKSAMKETLDSLFEDIKIPKKILRKLAKSYHQNNYSEVVLENSEFQTLYEGVFDEV
jgi:hypothetical protein